MAVHHEDNFYKSEIQSGGHGEAFQKDMALTLFLRMAKCDAIRMAYEMQIADKFDDIVLIDDEGKVIHFFQAKHGLIANGDKAKDIDMEALFPNEGSGDFDLKRYLKSYMTVNHRFEEKEKEKDYMKKYYVITNRDLSTKDNEWVTMEQEKVNEILHFRGQKAKHLKLNPKQKAIEEMCKNINTDIIELKEAIKEFFNSGMVSKLTTDYSTPLRDVLTIEKKKCRFSDNFNLESKQFSVAKLRSLFENDSFDMKKEVTVKNNFLQKESRLKFLPPFVSEEEVEAFFHDFTLSVGQPNDLRPVIDNELKTWMKTWIRPDILGGLGAKELDLIFTELNKKFEEFNKPIGKSLKRFLQKSDVEQSFREIQCKMEKDLKNHAWVKEETQYINRRIRFEKMERSMFATTVHHIGDCEFVKELRELFKDHQHIVLVADPGMGKTSLLQFVAFELQNQKDIHVFLVYFNALVKALNSLQKISDFNDALSVLSTVLSQDNCNIIRNALDQRDEGSHSIVLVLDGFDEIHARYTEKVLEMLKHLSSKKSIKFVISSRMHVKALLENNFNVTSMFLEPFSKDDQISYLRTVWSVPKDDEQIFLSYSEWLLSKFHSCSPSKLCEIFGLPLTMKMLAEIYADKFKQFLSVEKANKRQQFDLSEGELNISQLYDQFARKCFHKKLVEKYKFCGDLDDAELDSVIGGYILEHQLLAIKLLDTDIMEDLFKNLSYKEKYDKFRARCENESEKSLLVKVVNNNVQFSHLSYCEYFVATYLYDHICILPAEVTIRIFSEHEVVRQITFMKLMESEANFKILNDLFKHDCMAAIWAYEGGCERMVSYLIAYCKSLSIENLNIMLEESAKMGLNKALYSAAENGHVQLVELLLSLNADVIYWNYMGRTPLHMAVIYGHVDVVKLLLDNNSKPDETDFFQWNSLHYAALYGQMEVVVLLITKKVDINSRIKNGRTALHLATILGHATVVALLLNNNADPNIVAVEHKQKFTALDYAVQYGRIAIIKLLLDKGLDIHSRTDSGKTLLHRAAQRGYKDIVELLPKNGTRADYCKTAFDYAVEYGHVDLVRRFLKNNTNALHGSAYIGRVADDNSLLQVWIDINLRVIYGRTSLQVAALNGHADVVKVLLQNNVDPNGVNKIQWTALHFAARNGHWAVAKQLIDKGANTFSRSMCGRTPLHIAALNGHIAFAWLLIEFGANPNEKDNLQWTALHWAAKVSRTYDVVKMLITNGADPKSRTIFGKTPLHIAVLYGDRFVAELLIEHNSDPNEKDSNQWTALHLAARTGNFDLVKMLIAKGANPNFRTISGKTPHCIAKRFHHNEVAMFIKKRIDVNSIEAGKNYKYSQTSMGRY